VTTVVSSDRRGFIKALISDIKALRAELISVESFGEEVEGFGLPPNVARE
jgi:hypothetical protein